MNDQKQTEFDLQRQALKEKLLVELGAQRERRRRRQVAWQLSSILTFAIILIGTWKLIPNFLPSNEAFVDFREETHPESGAEISVPSPPDANDRDRDSSSQESQWIADDEAIATMEELGYIAAFAEIDGEKVLLVVSNE